MSVLTQLILTLTRHAQVFVLSGVRFKRVLRKKKVPDTCFIDTKTKGDILTATKRLSIS